MGQLTVALNLFLGLSVGSLAFSITLIRDTGFVISGCPKLAFQIGLVSLCLSVFFSCGAVVSRLLDYRYTARKIRADEKEEIEESGVYKYHSSILGQLTWRFFWSQLVTLIVGMSGLIIGVLSAYGNKIW